MRIGIIGCGLIGSRRANVIRQAETDELVIVADIDESRGQSLAKEIGCAATTDWSEVVSRDDVQAIVVSTVNKFLMPITVAALESGKHVLCEKPLGRNCNEARQMVRAARFNHAVLKTGFNHRHHPAIWKAHELCASGAIGPLMFIRSVYGHGGRLGYDKEWRADADLAGGGELLDQGVHIIDLCRWFLGEISEAFGQTATYFWDLGYFPPDPRLPPPVTRHQLEDNCFALLRTSGGQVATLHTSWTQWKNRFTFEVFGRDGYVIVDGIGGSYGAEKLTLGHCHAESGPPTEKCFEFPGPDRSWLAEWEEFTSAIQESRQPLANGEDGLQAMRVIDALYQSSRTGGLVKLVQSS